MRSSRGFTLIELMIVVAIIAILSSLAISAYVISTGKAQLSEAFVILDGMKTEVADYYGENSSCPTMGSNGFNPASSYSGNYVAAVNVTSLASGCAITAVMRSATVTPRLQNAQVMFTMSNGGAAGTIAWQCSSDANPVYLPASCR